MKKHRLKIRNTKKSGLHKKVRTIPLPRPDPPVYPEAPTKVPAVIPPQPTLPVAPVINDSNPQVTSTGMTWDPEDMNPAGTFPQDYAGGGHAEATTTIYINGQAVTMSGTMVITGTIRAVGSNSTGWIQQTTTYSNWPDTTFADGTPMGVMNGEVTWSQGGNTVNSTVTTPWPARVAAETAYQQALDYYNGYQALVTSLEAAAEATYQQALTAWQATCDAITAAYQAELAAFDAKNHHRK